MRGVRFLVVLVAVIGGAGIAGYTVVSYQAFLNRPLSPPAGPTVITVPRGASIDSITSDLASRGLLSEPLYLRIYARLNGAASRIKAGQYRITSSTTPRQLLTDMVAGKVVQYSLTIVEGWTFHQALAAIEADPHLKHTLAGLDDAEIMTRLHHPGQNPEGRFFPDTYTFPAGYSDQDLLERAYRVMQRRLAAIWSRRRPGLPLSSPYQALILASMIEKETGRAGERRRVAGVFVRRLERGMRLESDPTVIYGLGSAFDGDLTRADLQKDTPYNTYTHGGLPPTPIALPGLAALRAAVNPAPGEALYFVADGDGGHVFSRTLAEHDRAVRRYQLHK